MTVPGTDASVHLPAEPSSAGAARRFLAATLDAWGMADREEVACLLISELVSNVLLHTATEIDVHLERRGDRVRVEVHDGDPRLPERKFYSATSTTGRGLVFLATLATSWGVDAAADGKAVWFELDGTTAEAVTAPDLAADLRLEDFEDWDDLPGPAGPPDDPEAAASGRADASLPIGRLPVHVP